MKLGTSRPVKCSAGGALLALWVFASGCAEETNRPADILADDASGLDAAMLDASVPSVTIADAAPSTMSSNQPDASGGGPSSCMTRLAAHAFALDPRDCATRPAAPCTATDDRRYQRPLERSDDLAYELFRECDTGEGFYPVGITFNEQGCAEQFYSIPWPPSDLLLQCYLRALQTRRFPCGISCSMYFRLD